MEDQGRRLFLAIAIAFGIMMVWSLIFPPEQPPPAVQDQTAAGTAVVESGDSGRPNQPGSIKPKPASDTIAAVGTAVTAERGEEQLYEFDFPAFRAEFTSYGGTLKSWKLKGEKYQLEQNGKQQPIDLVRASESEAWWLFGIRFEQVDLIPDQAEWKLERRDDSEIQFSWSHIVDKDGEQVVLFDIFKTYRAYPDKYLLELTVDVFNRAAADQKLALTLSLHGYQDPNEDTGGGLGGIDRSWNTACYINGELTVDGLESLKESPKQRTGELRWGGLTQNYFLVAAAPKVEQGTQLGCNVFVQPEKPGVMRTDIVFPLVHLSAGDPAMTRTVNAYLGPKYLDELEGIATVIGYDPEFGKAIDLGFLSAIARPLLWLLQWFYSFVGNWGLAIVLLTVTVKLATLYWTTKSMRSMKKMAALQPKLKAIQEKYKDDRQKQQSATIDLYKAHKVNPMAGCLPMLLQMPIWFALYRMLMTAGELYRAPFIPGWINDLTAEDPYYIMPVVLMGMGFLQAKLSPTTGNSTQQKVMMYGLPLSFGVFAFFFPSGLTLYIFTNYLLTTLHQLWMNRTDPSRTEKSGASKDKAAVEAHNGDDEDIGTAADTSESADSDNGGGKSSKSRNNNKARKRGGQKKRGGKARK